MIGGCILNLDCPPPGDENPFTGSVTFSNHVFLPRSTTFPISGAQPYRNLRSQLAKLQNSPAVGFVHAAEQGIEREQYSRFNKFLSICYEALADYGFSTLRPIVWLVILWILSALVILAVDGAERPPEFEKVIYLGSWREILIDDGWVGRLSRAVLLSIYSMVNPLGVFGVKSLIVAKHWSLQVFLLFEGIMSIAFIALFILALRRRFRMQ